MKPIYSPSFLLWCLFIFTSSMLIAQEKNVGIGTTTPEGELHVTKIFHWEGIAFTGSGLNDLSVDHTNYSGMDQKKFDVVVSNAGPDPNLFKWSDDNGMTWTDFVPMSLSPILLSNGITVSFGSTSGHTYNDHWSWVVDIDYPDGLVVKNGSVGIGTSAPQAKLEVMGDILFHGDLMKNGSAMRLNDLQDAKSEIFGNSLFLGELAGNTWQTGNGANQNTGIGQSALQSLDYGIINTALGYSAMNANQIGSFNTAVGGNALLKNTTGNENISVGSSSMNENLQGNANCGLGVDALYSNTLGSRNVAIGRRALYHNYIQDNLIAIGDSALFTNSLGAIPYTPEAYNNIAIGTNALKSNSSGSSNLAIGVRAMERSVNGDENIAIGQHALTLNNGGNANCGIGHEALRGNTLGSGNIALGRRTLFHTTLQGELIAIGDSALYSNGQGAIPYTSEALRNIGIGSKALKSNSIGSGNIAIGFLSQTNSSYGDYNTSIGDISMYSNQYGNNNAAFGAGALYFNTTGGENTGVGVSAIQSNSTGSGNTAIGTNAYFITSDLDNTTAIGFNAGGINNASNRIEIGNSSVGWIGGQMGWSTYSDARIKTNVQENIPGIEFIKRLRPVSYHLDIHTQNALTISRQKEEKDWPSKYDIEEIRITGLIAQEVADAAEAVDYDFSGVEKAEGDVELYSLRYSSFVVPIIKALQEQQTMIESQKEEIEQLKKEITDLKKIIE